VLARVRRTLRERRLLFGGERVLLACSGGPDSMALLDVMHRLAPELDLALGVATVNHGLRPEASSEVELVRREAERRGLAFHPLEVEVASRASVQAAAREARYAALHELASSARYERIAVAHHLDDQAETVLQRLLRGSGLAGLSGIAPLRDDGVTRPLLDVTRAEIESHLERFEIPFVRDPSNEDPKHTRVRLRTRILPALRDEDPRIHLHLAALADEARALRAHLEGELAGHTPRGRSLDRDVVDRCPPLLRAELLARWIEQELGVVLGREHRDEALAVYARGGEQLLPGANVLTRSGEKLLLVASSKPGGRAQNPGNSRGPRGNRD
jgi:tRNA(Ile)-lysidine synthase